MRRRSRAAAIAVLGLLLGTVVLVAPADASATTYLRLAHLSPDTANADISVTSVTDRTRTFTVRGAGYGSISGYRRIEPDTYLVGIRPRGAPASSPPTVSGTLTATPGTAFTVALFGMREDRNIEIITDELGLAGPGQSRVRVVNAAPSAPPIDVAIAGGPMLAGGTAYAMATGYQSVPAGPQAVVVGPAGGPTTTAAVEFDPNCVHTVLVVERGGPFAVQVVTDARGSGEGVVPVGGMDTGFGGTAGRLPFGNVGALVLLAVATVLAAVVVARPRRAEP